MLKYYEAMRLGATLRPQAFGYLFDGVGTCANGAAREAIGRLGDDTLETYRLFDFARTDAPCCPDCALHHWHKICGLVTHLNDRHRWTRQQIADWLEPLEEVYWRSKEPPLSEFVSALREHADEMKAVTASIFGET